MTTVPIHFKQGGRGRMFEGKIRFRNERCFGIELPEQWKKKTPVEYIVILRHPNTALDMLVAAAHSTPALELAQNVEFRKLARMALAVELDEKTPAE